MVQLMEMVSLNIYILYIQYIWSFLLSDSCQTHYVTVHEDYRKKPRRRS